MSGSQIEAPLNEQPMNGTSFRQSWANFFANVGALCSGSVQGAAPYALPVSGSPFAYTVPTRGTLVLTGGTVAGVTLNRAGVNLNLGPLVLLPVMAGDSVTVFYTATPTVQFLAG